MSEKTYIATTVSRSPRPRSKRLRDAGFGGSGGGGSTAVVFSGDQSTTIVTGSTHNHSNLNVLEQINTDSQGYVWLTQMREMLEAGVSVSQIVTDKAKAGYADKAHDLDEDSPVMRKFLSRQSNDTAQGHIDFRQGLTSQLPVMLMGGAQFGAFNTGMYGGYGGKVDNLGNAEFETLKVRGGAEFMEVIINRLTAIEGDQLLTESDTVESVTALGNGRFGLHLKRKYEGYFTAFTENAVIRGTVNNIYEAALSGVPLSYYTSWMRVNLVNTVANYIEVVTYSGSECPGGQNFIPCPLMRIARWGHQTDPTRQTCIVLSTTERRIIFYQNVTKPIIDDSNIGMCLGKAPEFLKQSHQIDDNQNYLYTKGVFTQGTYHVNIKGEPIYEHTIRGNWVDPNVSGEDYYFKGLNPSTNKWEISHVYDQGCQWQCLKDKTKQRPSFTSTDWAMTVGDSSFRAEFVEPEKVHRLQSFDTTLTVRAWLGWTDVTADLPDDNVGWTRYTEDKNGNQRVASDNVWAVRRGNSGKQIRLTRDDLDINSDGMPKKIIFTATVQLTEGITAVAKFTY